MRARPHRRAFLPLVDAADDFAVAKADELIEQDGPLLSALGREWHIAAPANATVMSAVGDRVVRGSASIRLDWGIERTLSSAPKIQDQDCTPPGRRTVNTEPLPGSLATVMSPPII